MVPSKMMTSSMTVINLMIGRRPDTRGILKPALRGGGGKALKFLKNENCSLALFSFYEILAVANGRFLGFLVLTLDWVHVDCHEEANLPRMKPNSQPHQNKKSYSGC